MSVEVIKTFTTTCYGAVHDAINNDAAFSAVTLEQVVASGGTTTSFFFSTVLTGPEDIALDNLLAVWVCPPTVSPDSPNGTLVSTELDTVDVSAITEDSYIIYDFSASKWDIIPTPTSGSSGKLLQVKMGDIPAQSGTTKIPKDSSVPLITEGSEIWSQTFTPTNTASVIRINTNVTASFSEDKKNIVFAVFRDNVCIGTALQNITKKKSGFVVSLSVTDLPNTITSVTYSVRVGRTGNNDVWYINDIHNTPNAFGGTLINNGYSVEELEII